MTPLVLVTLCNLRKTTDWSVHFPLQCCGSGMIFSDPDPTFQLVSDPTWIFSNNLNKNFTFVFPSCKRVWLHLWRDISFLVKFFMKINIYFLIEPFCWESVKFFQFFRAVLLKIHFGSVSCPDREWFFQIRFRTCYKFRIRPDPVPQHCFTAVRYRVPYIAKFYN